MASLSSPPASSSPSLHRLAGRSQLHLQLLLMLGSCHRSGEVMKEAERVQRLLMKMEPKDSEDAQPAPAAKKKKGKALAAAAAVSAATGASVAASATSGATAATGAPAAAAAAASSPSSAVSASSSAPVSAFELCSASALAALAASSDPWDGLLRAMVLDPANPWTQPAHDVNACLQAYGLAAIKVPSTYACARLAHFYITGEYAVGKDLAKGAKWLRMGGSKGHAMCQYQLGYLHEEGMGVAQSAAEAIVWYRKAAELKYPNAMFNLASLLLEPDGTHEGVEQDVYTGIRLMEDAAALGDASSQLRLGHLCFKGAPELDIDASISRCIAYLTMAAHNENEPSVDAAKILGIIFSTESDSFENENFNLDKAVKYLSIAAASGHEGSETLLAQAKFKRDKQEKKIILDRASPHLAALEKLSLQEGKALDKRVLASDAAAADAAAVSAAAESLQSTPSPESLFLALARLHSRWPDYGCSRLATALKAEYPHWAVSEKRIKQVMKENAWTGDGGVTGNGAVMATVIAAATGTAPTPARVLADVTSGPIRMKDHVINDLD